jgi:ferric-dicitrate binding protein FerR (iron transport regulator)
MNAFNVTEQLLNDSDWLAVRFVLGELSASEAAAFEQQLASDQAARDAVVRATMLVETLAAIPAPMVQPVRRTIARRIVAALTVVAAGVCIAIVGYRSLIPPMPQIVEQKSARAVDPTRLATLWLDSANSLNGIPDVESADESSTDSESALLPPDWLLAAVEQEEAMLSDEPAFDADSDKIERN